MMGRLSLLLLAALVILVAASLASAQTGDLDLTWHTVDSGGGRSVGGDRFALSGTIGQIDTTRLSGELYSLQGGFWELASPGVWQVYLPLILR